MILARPASYVSAPEFRVMPNDYDLSAYDDTKLDSMLTRASGVADAILGKSLLAQERLERFYGRGNSTLSLHRRPLLYVKQLAFVIPGLVGATIPLDRVSVDYVRGTLSVIRPLLYAGAGYQDFFPERVPIDVTFAWGYGRNTFYAPTWTSFDGYAGSIALAPGAYTIGVTTRTQWGETLPSMQTVTTTTGAIVVTVQQTLGAYSYRIYAAPSAGGSAPVAPSSLSLVAEIPCTTFTDGPSQATISSLNPPPMQFPATAPTYDSAAPAMPSEIREAVRLLTLMIIYEQNNLSNRGIQRQESGRVGVAWRSTEGSSGKGVPLYYDQAVELLSPFIPEIY